MAYYFAYGSNMCTARLQERVPSAKPIGRAVLKKYRFVCNNESKDGSAKASIISTGDDNDMVWGVLYELPKEHVKCLDKAEGVSCGTYDKRKGLTVIKDGCSKVEKVMTYIGKDTDTTGELKPYNWYLKYIICGAEEHGLPKGYIDKLRDIETKEGKRPYKRSYDENKKCCC